MALPQMTCELRSPSHSTSRTQRESCSSYLDFILGWPWVNKLKDNTNSCSHVSNFLKHHWRNKSNNLSGETTVILNFEKSNTQTLDIFTFLTSCAHSSKQTRQTPSCDAQDNNAQWQWSRYEVETRVQNQQVGCDIDGRVCSVDATKRMRQQWQEDTTQSTSIKPSIIHSTWFQTTCAKYFHISITRCAKGQHTTHNRRDTTRNITRNTTRNITRNSTTHSPTNSV